MRRNPLVALLCVVTCGLVAPALATGEPTRLVLLLRHGEAAYTDAEGRPVIDTDLVALTARGEAQARTLGPWLRTLGLGRIDRVLVSPLPRAQQTARLLAEGLGLPAASLQTVAALRELPAGDVAAVQAARTAALEELERLRKDGNWQTALLVAHGGIHRALLGRALGTSPDAALRAALSPACLHLLELRADGEWLVRGTNWCVDGPDTGRPRADGHDPGKPPPGVK